MDAFTQLAAVSIWIHAAAGAVAFAAAVLVLATGRGRALHVAAVAVLALAVLPPVFADWAQTPPVLQATWLGLVGLACVMTVLAWRAWRRPLVGGRRCTPGHVGELGFNAIALVMGFSIVAALRSGWPAWAVVGLGVTVVVVGHVWLRVGQARARRWAPGADAGGRDERTGAAIARTAAGS